MAISRERGAQWLRGELPGLVTTGVISAETARALEQHYTAGRSRNVGFVLLATVGSALVAAGIILLIAHNWDMLSRPVRSALAFLPLVAAQLLCVFVLLRRDDSRPWRESAAIFNVAGIGTAIALVSQTYQFHGSFANFLLIWMLLSLPLIYLMRTTLGASAYLLGATWWVWIRETRTDGPGGLPFWLLLVLVLPFVIAVHRRDRHSPETTALWMICALAICFGIGTTADFTRANLGVPAFAGFFTVVYLVGMESFGRPHDDRLHPLALLGGVAIGVLAIVLTFAELWRFTVPYVDSWDWRRPVAIAIQLSFPAVALGLAGWSLIRGRAQFSYAAAAFPLVVALGWIVVRRCAWHSGERATDECVAPAAILLNLYTFALGVELIARGLRAQSAARTNFGLLVIAGLALARFFDSDISFVLRAVGFIAIGLGFLVTNAILFRKRGAA